MTSDFMPASMADNRKMASVQTSTGIVAETALFTLACLWGFTVSDRVGNLSRLASGYQSAAGLQGCQGWI